MENTYSHRIQEEASGVRPLSTVLRTLEVMNFLAHQTRPQKLAEIATALGLSRPTAYQRLFTLVEAGWLEQDDVGRYRVSMLAARMATAAMDQADLGVRADPALARLVAAVHETASLSMLDRGQPCIVSRVETDSLLRADQKLGTFMALDGSASGRVLTAFADEATLTLLRQGAHPMADEAVLADVRARGYALSSGYTHSGVKGFAAPVYDLQGRCRAAVSVVVPEIRFDLDRFRQPVLDAAAEISRILQGAAP
jgi:Transcriptional regulator